MFTLQTASCACRKWTTLAVSGSDDDNTDEDEDEDDGGPLCMAARGVRREAEWVSNGRDWSTGETQIESVCN